MKFKNEFSKIEETKRLAECVNVVEVEQVEENLHLDNEFRNFFILIDENTRKHFLNLKF